MAGNKDAAPEMTGGNVEVLPNEILTYIFSMLSAKERQNIELVSPRWRQLSLDLWKTTKEFGFGLCFAATFMKYQLNTINRSICEAILQRCRLEKIAWTGGSRIDGAVLPLIAEHCPNLVSLHLEHSHFSIAQHSYPNRFRNKTTSDAMLSLIVKNCRSLRRLFVRDCDLVYGDFISDANCSLLSLSLSGCSGRRLGFGNDSDWDNLVDLIAEKWPNLTDLDLSHVQCRKMNQIGNLKLLKRLKLNSYCGPAGWQEDIPAIFANKLSLKELDASVDREFSMISNFDDSKFNEMLSLLPALEFLNITNQAKVSNASLNRWFSGGVKVGLRRRDAPLELICSETGIIDPKADAAVAPADEAGAAVDEAGGVAANEAGAVAADEAGAAQRFAPWKLEKFEDGCVAS